MNNVVRIHVEHDWKMEQSEFLLVQWLCNSNASKPIVAILHCSSRSTLSWWQNEQWWDCDTACKICFETIRFLQTVQIFIPVSAIERFIMVECGSGWQSTLTRSKINSSFVLLFCYIIFTSTLPYLISISHGLFYSIFSETSIQHHS